MNTTETTAPQAKDYILTLSCPDKRGIVHAVSGFLAERGCNILESAQFGDTLTGNFFMRVHFSDEEHQADGLQSAFQTLGQQYQMDWKIQDAAKQPRVLVLVSKIGHCLNDLLYRKSSGLLHADIRAVISNHRDFEELTKAHQIPFHYLPVTKDNKEQQEQRLMEIVEQEKIDLVVLARYMQVLSPALCRRLRGKIINIHHSFLPSFKGARPYAQAHARGVKLIGATAHFVTDDLDEGPIIEQDTVRVRHSLSAEQFTAMGRDVECVVLARAVDWFVRNRILLNGDKTIVFQ
ncbi:formyltetrahydrofolate deformylase [Oxalobacteraceae bacterium GrIS 2.11]